MEFYPPNVPVPHGIRTGEFTLIPLRAAHNALDHAAVMATQEELRQRGNGDWPRPDFTPEENLADLEEHEADFHARRGFTYSVQTPDATRCLGCVYVYSLADSLRRQGADEQVIADLGPNAASVWFWVRPDALAAGLDERLLGVLLPWLRDEFAFARVAIIAWGSDSRQADLCRNAGLKRLWPTQDGTDGANYFR